VSSATAAARGGAVLDALRSLPGGQQLLALAGERDDLALVGGAVRDLLLGRSPRELDVVLAGDAASFAQELAARLDADATAPATVTAHDRFGTAMLEWDAGRIDIAERRAECYPAPGALPQVRSGSSEEDLERRDFTVNAIAVALGDARRGELTSVADALEDLDAGRLRVLHERSFIDDPTRLLRLARYRARLGFELEPATAALATRALQEGALMSVSRARVGAELRLALAEADAPAALDSMAELGVLAALTPGLRFEGDLAERALALLPEDGRSDLLLMASLLLHLTVMPTQDPEPAIFGILDEMEFVAADRERTMRSALAAPRLVAAITNAGSPSQLRAALFTHTPEAIALAAALAGESSPSAAAAARDWFERVRLVHLQITGDDLLAAGVAPGPEIGARLTAALARRLDGELEDSRDAELRAALDAAIER
jgi:tRNA nucleotidyltransferase (CCA-adding enzyme)